MLQLTLGVQRIGIDQDQPGTKNPPGRDRVLQQVWQLNRHPVSFLQAPFAKQPCAELAAVFFHLGKRHILAEGSECNPVRKLLHRLIENRQQVGVVVNVQFRDD